MNVLQLKFKDIAEYSDFLSLVTNIAYVQNISLKLINHFELVSSAGEGEILFQVKDPHPEEAKIYTHIYKTIREGE